MKNNRTAKKRNTKSIEDRKTLKDGKIEDRKNPKNQKFFTKGFVIFLIVVILAILIFNLFRHPYLKVSQVYVLGNSKLEDTEIIANMKSPIGKNILTYNARQAEEELMSYDFIESADVKKVFPNIVKVNVEEIYPQFLLNGKNGDVYISNRASIIDSSKINDDLKESLVTLKIDSYNTNPKEYISKDTDINDFIKEISKANYISLIDQLNFENKAHIGIIIKDIEVDFGNLDKSSYKILLLESIIKDVESKGLDVTSISLVNVENPVVEINEDS